MRDSWNSVLDLLVYTQNVQLNEILDQRYKAPTLTLDINPFLMMACHVLTLHILHSCINTM